MRAFASACASLAALGALAAPASAAAPSVASLNLCTDEYALLLAGPSQVASVSYLSHDPQETPLWRSARRAVANDGSILSVARHRPRLILTMGKAGRGSERIARALGARLLVLPYPQSLDDIDAAIVQVSAALGRETSGRQWRERLGRLRSTAPVAAREVLWLGGGGRTMAATGLGAQWLRLAGYRPSRVANDQVTLESLLARQPTLLIRPLYRRGQVSGETRWLDHPAHRQVRTTRSLATDGRRWTCMGPSLIAEIERLRGSAR